MNIFYEAQKKLNLFNNKKYTSTAVKMLGADETFDSAKSELRPNRPVPQNA
jgi:hypothetical protein